MRCCEEDSRFTHLYIHTLLDGGDSAFEELHNENWWFTFDRETGIVYWSYDTNPKIAEILAVTK